MAELIEGDPVVCKGNTELVMRIEQIFPDLDVYVCVFSESGRQYFREYPASELIPAKDHPSLRATMV